MKTKATCKTRYQDWQDRRQFLRSLSPADPYIVHQIKLLDYLIRRYGDTAVAHQPVRFDFRRDFQWNDRRITVHHHLGRGKVAGVQNREDAERRIADLLQRMTSDEPREDDEFDPMDVPERSMHPLEFHNVDWLIKLGWRIDFHIRAKLSAYPILSETCLKHLASRLTDDTCEDRTALDLFLMCENRNIIDWTVRIWRERVMQARRASWITGVLELRIQFAEDQSRAVDLIRERLADDNAEVRIGASEVIAKIGDLDDFGLLSDLLALSPTSDEDPRERDAITSAMTTIAQRKVLQ